MPVAVSSTPFARQSRSGGLKSARDRWNSEVAPIARTTSSRNPSVDDRPAARNASSTRPRTNDRAIPL